MGSTITPPFVESIRRRGFAGADFSAMDEGDKQIGDDAAAAFRRRLDLEPAEHDPLPKAGVVKWFDAKKGFGFIIDEVGRDVFVHYTVIEGTGYRKLNDSEKVRYAAVVKGDRLCATCVRRIEPVNPGFVPTAESPEG